LSPLGKAEHKPRGHEKKIKFMQDKIKNKIKGQYKGTKNKTKELIILYWN